MNTNNQTARILGLDIIRTIAILLVVKTHAAFLFKNTAYEDFTLIRLIDGVDFFFVLSGFLIGNILLKEINAVKLFTIKDLWMFWKRRWFRTLPNYYLILFINIIIIYFGLVHGNLNFFNWKFLFFLQNFSSPFYSFFLESWSLTIEEWFYISTPLLLLLFLKGMSPKKSFLLTTLIMLILPFLYRIYITNSQIIDFETYDITYRKIVLTRLDCIAYGLFASWFLYYYTNYWEKYKYYTLAIGILLMTFILNYGSPYSSFYRQVLYFSLCPLSVMFLLPFANSIKSASGYIAKGVVHISKISYSMYLINLSIVAAIIGDNFEPKNIYDSLFKYLLYWMIVIVFSTILYKYFEKPMMNLRDKF